MIDHKTLTWQVEVTITQEQFDGLLAWLGSDRDSAGRRYEDIRSALVRLFVAKGFIDAEDLADETINRVMVRLPQIKDRYIGEPACYFHGVARNIIRESLRRREIKGEYGEIYVDAKLDSSEMEHDCLRHCLERLTSNKRQLVLDYYLFEGHRKIEHHKQMAGKLKITVPAVRSRVYQIRLKLQRCMRGCAFNKDCQNTHDTCMARPLTIITKHARQRASYL